MSEWMHWGDREAAHGVANRNGIDRRFWDACWFAWAYRRESEGNGWDGITRFEGNMWRSENDAFIHVPYAVINDFGALVPVPWQYDVLEFYGDECASWRAPT